MATAAGHGPGPCAQCARCTIRCGPRTAMFPRSGGRCRRCRAGSTHSVANAAGGAAVRQELRNRSLAVRAGDAGAARRTREPAGQQAESEPEHPPAREIIANEPPPPPPAAQDNSPALSPVLGASAAPAPAATPAAAPPPPTASVAVASAPLFRARTDLPGGTASDIPPVIPILRAPDDPGIDDDPVSDEFEQPPAQAGGWRGFLSRWGG